MPTRSLTELRRLVLALSLIAGSTTPLIARADDGPAPDPTPAAKADDAMAEKKDDAKPVTPDEPKVKSESLLADFAHYVLIDRPDLAKTMADDLLARNLSDVDFAKLVERTIGEQRFGRAVARAQRLPDLEASASKLLKAYEGGKLAAARDPGAVAENIKLLTGTMRQRLFARDRLIQAGEYATPQLLSTLLNKDDAAMGAEVRQLLVDMGRQSVAPLTTALPNLAPAEQVVVIGILGDMPQTASLPFLYAVMEGTKDDSVRSAADGAIRRIAGVTNTQMPLADRFNDLAMAYWKASPSLISFPGEANQLYWSYNPGAGLLFQAIDSRVWPQAMAMRLSEEALRVDPNNARAVATWIGANFSREIHTPEGYVNPAYPADRRDAMFYAVAAGSGPSQRVLAHALDTSDTKLARKSLAAIEKTVGGKGLWSALPSESRKPLLEALKYPNRRVQYDAALALGAAQPREAFEGSDQVVRIMAGTIRDASAKYALVVAATNEQQTSLSGLLKDQGYTLLPPATRLDDVRQAVADAPGVDLVVTNLPSESTATFISEAQSDPRLRATPVLGLVSMQGYSDLAARYSRDPRVKIAREGLGAKEIAEASRQLVEAASGGPIVGDEAEMYKTRALGTLRDLAVGNNTVLNVADASAPLVSALPEATGETRFRIAEVLSYINTKTAQGTLFDHAMGASSEDRARLFATTAESAKRFGNLLDQRQVDALVEFTSKATGDEATAAAALMGALNLPGTNIVPLILMTAPKA